MVNVNELNTTISDFRNTVGALSEIKVIRLSRFMKRQCVRMTLEMGALPAICSRRHG